MTAAGRLFPLFDALRDHGDVILLDQRACVVDEMVLRRDRPRFHSDRVVSRDEYLHLITSTVGVGISTTSPRAQLIRTRSIPTRARTMWP